MEKTAQENLKLAAQAEKLREEALSSKAEREREDKKAERELQKLDAEIAKLVAESRAASMKAEEADIDLQRAREKRRDELAGNRYHHLYAFTEQVAESSVKDCMKQLAIWRRNEPACEIEIVFSSPGGSVIHGMALYDYIQQLRRAGHKVTTGALGYAASMAGILLQAGDQRWMGAECQPGESLVLLPDLTWVRQDSLYPGMEILGFDEFGERGIGLYRRWRTARVEQMDRVVRDCFEVRLSDGQTHITTAKHPWLSPSSGGHGGWLQTESFNRFSSRPTRVSKLLRPVSPESTYEAGWMAGLLDGEGCLQRTNGVTGVCLSLSQATGSVLDRALAWSAARNFTWYQNVLPAEGTHKERSALRLHGGLDEVARLLQLTRPVRLLPKFQQLLEGQRLTTLREPGQSGRANLGVPVQSVIPVGKAEVVRLQTTTGTYIGAGMGMHNCYLLVHEIQSGAVGKIGEMEDEMKLLHKMQDRILGIFASRAHLSKTQIDNRWKRKDWWLDSTEALKLGFVDEVR